MHYLDPPPTLEQHRRLMASRERSLTDDPIGTHERPGTKPRKVRRDVEPDILRRQCDPIDGERTPEQAQAIRNNKGMSDV